MDFIKISATGNDFILLDNRDNHFDAYDAKLVSKICARRTGVGADGIILIENSDRADFKYVHINSDGSIAEMCGNGSRAISYYANKLGIVGTSMTFEIDDKIYSSTVDGLMVKTDFVPPTDNRMNLSIVEESDLEEGGFWDTGVPHFIIFSEDVDSVDVDNLGRKYRYHETFPKGSNIDFVQIIDNSSIKMRTYERGVEGETLACGTGAVASALIANMQKGTSAPTAVSFPGGDLKIGFDSEFNKVSLSGAVTPVYTGQLLL